MGRMTRFGFKAALTAMVALAFVAVVPGVALAESDGIGGVLVRVGGDATIGPDEEVATVVVVSGDLELSGVANTVVVVDGSVVLTGARIDNLVVVRGQVALTEGTVVTGDVWLPDSSLTNDGSASVEGDVIDDLSGLGGAFFLFGLLFLAGLGLLTIVAALVMAAVAPTTARKAGLAVREEFPRVLLAGVIFWIVLPVVAALLLVTAVGTPTALAIFGFVMPMLGLLGYLVAVIFVGEAIVSGDRDKAHPYAAAAVGAIVLIFVNLVPFFGALVGTLATLIGASALALLGWRAFRGGAHPVPAEPAG